MPQAGDIESMSSLLSVARSSRHLHLEHRELYLVAGIWGDCPSAAGVQMEDVFTMSSICRP